MSVTSSFAPLPRTLSLHFRTHISKSASDNEALGEFIFLFAGNFEELKGI